MKKILIILFVCLFGFCGFYIWYKFSLKAKGGSKILEISIPQQSGDEEVAEILKEQGLIRSAYAFRIYAFLSKKDKKIKAGTYLINSDYSIPEIINILVAGEVLTYKITIPEGMTIEETDKYLSNKYSSYGFKEGDWKKVLKESGLSPQLNTLFPQAKNNLEGFLLGDTYFLRKENTGYDLVGKMLQNFQDKALWFFEEKMPEGLKNIYEALILASLVENEANNKKDRRIVAGIFLKRLRNNDFLQSCASINYLLPEKKKVLSQDDLKIRSPFNTYINKGLPPSPIASPSLESIEAVFRSLPSDYYYFLSDEKNNLFFSQTFEEHLEKRKQILGE